MHLSTPPVAERVRELKDAGIITGYHARVDPDAIGLAIRAVIRVKANRMSYDRVLASGIEIPDVVECRHVTGTDDLILTALVESVAHLEDVFERLQPCGDYVTSISLSNPDEPRPVGRKNNRDPAERSAAGWTLLASSDCYEIVASLVATLIPV